ncbi:MAG: serine hydrolase [Gemmatimonadetes bacterium]|nr:serine hydrolase [Gemmatimonadota bacterium]
MRRTLPLAPILAFLAACGGPRPSSGPASGGGWSALDAALRQRIAAVAPAEVAVSVIDLASGRTLGIHDTVTMHAASTMKVPVLIELFRQAEHGRVRLDDSIRVVNEFTSIADGSRYTLDAGDDSDSAVYALVGRRVPVRELARHMIVRSSNLATNDLIALVTPDSVQKTMRAIGAEGMRVLRGVEDGPAFRKGLNNTTTAQGLARALEAIAACKVTSRASCDAMVDILAGQEFNAMIPAGLPAGTRVAHKTGWITGIQHDGAIVYPPGRAPYILVVLTRGFTDTVRAAHVGADISRLVWRTLVDGRPPAAAGPAGTDAILAKYAEHRVAAITTRRFTHAALWGAIGPLIDSSSTLTRREIGKSAEGRPIYAVQYGHGPTRVLLWSQMHGDESTATMALADIFDFLSRSPDDPLARRIADKLTVVFVPMLNPDGAERFQRRDAYGIDVNRDARRLSTPEAQALKQIHTEFRPDFGFNLHDQNVRTRISGTESLAAIALLAPRPDTSHVDTPGLIRAQHLAAAVREAIEPLVGGHIAKYDDTHNPRAFGDLIQRWGTSTILIESGGWRDDPEKQYLRRVNFVAILAALDAIATGSYARSDLALYRSLPYNGSSVRDLLVRGGRIVLPGMPPYRADLAIDYQDALLRTAPRIADVGDLDDVLARDTIDATGLSIHPAPGARGDGFGTGRPASLTIRRGAEPNSPAVWVVDGGAPVPASAAAGG